MVAQTIACDHVLGRIAARVVTGPLAFLLGGVIDVLAYAAASAHARLRLARRG
jgi:hypothetical protein